MLSSAALDALVSISQTLLRMDLPPGATPTTFAIRHTVESVAKELLKLESATLEDMAVAELMRRYCIQRVTA